MAPTRWGSQLVGLGTPDTPRPTAGDCKQQDSLSPKGSAAHRVCPGIALGLESICWQICIALPVSPVQYPQRGPWASLFGPVQLTSHDRASKLPNTLNKVGKSVPRWLYSVEHTTPSQHIKLSFLQCFSKPREACMYGCHQPTGRCRSSSSALASLRGQDWLLSPPATGWLFDCVCSEQALQHNHISKFITQAQIAGASFRDRKLWHLQLLVARGHAR